QRRRLQLVVVLHGAAVAQLDAAHVAERAHPVGDESGQQREAHHARHDRPREALRPRALGAREAAVLVAATVAAHVVQRHELFDVLGRRLVLLDELVAGPDVLEVALLLGGASHYFSSRGATWRRTIELSTADTSSPRWFA